VGGEAQLARRTPIGIVIAVNATPNVTVTFDQPVIYSGILPGWTTFDDAQTCDLVTRTSDTVWVLHFTGLVVLPINIPFEDPAFRNSGGGYVRDVTIPAET
jgi:hypothetical protein